VVSGSGDRDLVEVPVPPDPDDPHRWCVMALERLDRGRPEAALEAARRAVEHDSPDGPAADWGYRLASLAFERLGRDAEAVAAAEEAVRLAPGSWAARLRLGSALRRIPGRWAESRSQTARAVRYAPEEPDPHVLAGDLALLRGEHRQARAAYLAALRRAGDHPGARVNLGLAFLRWERPRNHHDPAWPVDPRETGRTRRALETWSRQTRILLAAALLAAVTAALGPGLTAEARICAAAAPAAVLVITFRQARRIALWSYVPAMLARDVWLGLTVAAAPAAVAAYVAAVATLPSALAGTAAGAAADALPGTVAGAVAGAAALPGLAMGPWAVPAGVVLLNGVALLVTRVLTEAWRGRPVRALAEFSAAGGDRTAGRDTGVTLWLVAGRAWSVLAAAAATAGVLDDPRWGLVAPAVPIALVLVHRGGGLAPRLRGILAADRCLAATLALLVTASLALGGAAAAALLGLSGRLVRLTWQAAAGMLAAVVTAYAIRSVRAWWRGAPGPRRASLAMSDSRGRRLPGDVRPPVRLSGEVRRAFTSARGVVLAYAGRTGPRALAVGSVGSVGPAGELRLIAADEAWDAAERDPRVAVFVADPLERRFWAEVRGIAIGDAEAETLRVTPKHVVVGEYPGRHQGRFRRG
jgi:tetratricopeptide (TPR) repeat protein